MALERVELRPNPSNWSSRSQLCIVQERRNCTADRFAAHVYCDACFSRGSFDVDLSFNFVLVSVLKNTVMSADAAPNLDLLGHHDVVGHPRVNTLAKIDTTPVTYSYWERMVHALLIALVGRGLITVDEMRRGVEGLEERMYERLTYYERWAASMTAILVERKVITRKELETAMEGADPAVHNAPFAVGNRVVVKAEGAIRRWRKPHLRIPGYIHGAEGVIEAVRGKFEDPAYLAFRESGAVVLGGDDADGDKKRFQYLYSVRFPAQLDTGVLRQAGAESLDTISLDIFHPWLRPAAASAAPNSARTKEDNAELAPSPVEKHKDDHHRHHHDHHHHHAHHHQAAHSSHKHHHDHVHLDRTTTECNAVAKEGEEKPLQRLAEALFQILDRKNIVSMAELRAGVEKLDDVTNKRGYGPKLVAKAWVDPEFKSLLLRDPSVAAAKLGISTSNYASKTPSMHPASSNQQPPEAADKEHSRGTTLLVVVENTPTEHHLVVCTLCSCYPAAVLGLSPDWYKSRSYRAQAVLRPRALLKESFGFEVPKQKKIVVHDSTAEIRYLVLPERPAGTEGWTEEQLQCLVTRDTMIGVTVPLVPESHQIGGTSKL